LSGVVIGIVVLDIVLIAIVAFVMPPGPPAGRPPQDRQVPHVARRALGSHARDEASVSTIERA